MSLPPKKRVENRPSQEESLTETVETPRRNEVDMDSSGSDSSDDDRGVSPMSHDQREAVSPLSHRVASDQEGGVSPVPMVISHAQSAQKFRPWNDTEDDEPINVDNIKDEEDDDIAVKEDIESQRPVVIRPPIVQVRAIF